MRERKEQKVTPGLEGLMQTLLSQATSKKKHVWPVGQPEPRAGGKELQARCGQ